MSVIVVGLAYFAIIFSFAFAMGVARALVVAPLVGEAAAVFLEVPVLLVASWFVSRRLVRDQLFSLAQLASIGAIAFALTMASEAVLANIIRAQSLAEWASQLASPLGLVGLGAQLSFAGVPSFAGGRQMTQWHEP